jgi:hypothetical protein
VISVVDFMSRSVLRFSWELKLRQEPNNNIKAVSNYLSAGGPFKGKDGYLKLS